MKRIHVAVLIATMGVPSVHATETIGVLAVAPPPGPASELAEIAAQIRNAIARLSLGVLEPGQVRERMSATRPRTTLAELDRRFESARSQYLRGDMKGSIRSLKRLVAPLEEFPQSAEATNQWLRVMLRIGRTESDLGHREAEFAAFEQVLIAHPSLKLDSVWYSPRRCEKRSGPHPPSSSQSTHTARRNRAGNATGSAGRGWGP